MREPRRRQQAAAAARNNVAPAARSTNLMDMPLDEFQGALAELAQQGGVDTDALLRQYRSANSPFAAVNRAAEGASADLAAAGRRPVAGSAGFLSRPIDGSGGVGLNLGGGLLGMLAGAGQAIDAPMAAYQGLMPEQDMALEALGTGSMAMLGGGAMTRPAGSFGMGGRVAPDIDARVAAARQAVLDNPNDAALFDQYKAIRRGRDALGSRPESAPATQFATPEDEGFAAYLERVNPQGTRIEAAARPNLAMGDMYGMLPRNARKVSERDGVTFYQAQDGATYAAAFNPDVGEMDVVGYSLPGGNSTELAVVGEMQGRGIGGELQYLARSQDPYAQTGGLTDAGRGSLERTYNRLRDEGIISANRDQTTGLLGTMAAAEPRNTAERMARDILDMRAAGRAGEVTDEMMAQADPQYMYANTPLPMDEASRMVRAGETGLVDSQYHATMADFPAFLPSQTGLVGRGVYSGDFADGISDYARAGYTTTDGLNIIPMVTPSDATYARRIDWQNTIDADDQFPYNATPDETVEGFRRAADNMSAQGLSGVRSQDGERVTFNPRNIRSRFARFDPEFSHLSNLSAANIDPFAGLFGAMAAEEQRRQRNAP